MAFYRFKCGVFVKADTFAEAKAKFIERIEQEIEDKDQWHKCTCVGFQHHWDCPEKAKEEIAF